MMFMINNFKIDHYLIIEGRCPIFSTKLTPNSWNYLLLVLNDVKTNKKYIFYR